MSLSMEDRLKRRKLDALKRGVHRITGGETLPMTTHVIGIGKSGADAIAEILQTREPGAPRITALAIDIGDQDLRPLRKLAESIPSDQAEITIISLDVPRLDDLLATLGQYGEFLRLEYPQYRWGPTPPPWLDDDTALPASGSHFPRAVAKAIYGHAYYQAPRPLERALRAFAAGVDANRSQAVVAIIFGLGGGTGSGIAVDLARHLSNGLFGRRVLVAGIGIAPCALDPSDHTGGHLFSVINELDVLGDEAKNKSVTISCGELFRNPFTAGFILVPQQHIVENSLAATHRWIDRQIATLVNGRGGANLWELLRLLNWVAAPSTQHSAARTPWGAQWIHMLASVDVAGAFATDLRERLGLLPGYSAEFIELRVPAVDAVAADLAAAIDAAFHPDVPPQIVDGSREGTAQFILPRIGKNDLALFHNARAAYQGQSPDERRLVHAMLLDQGVLLCEPSTKLEGMAGASLQGSDSWIAVPLAAVWGESPPDAVAEATFNEPVSA
jgi:hypothetical protein